MNGVIEKARVLAEALPYIKSFYGKTVVIKYGGSTLGNAANLAEDTILTDIILMRYVGMNPIVVHGGGPEITGMLQRLDKKSEFIDGLRVTDAETAEIAEMVLVGKMNRAIVAAINQLGGRAVGVGGKDGMLIRARKRLHESANGPVDLGYVGDVEEINPALLETLVSSGYIPVVSPVAYGAGGATYNVNADSVAGELAAALQAHKLVLLTDVEGFYRDFSDKSSIVSTLPLGQLKQLMAEGQVAGGMIPKLGACVRALEGGVAQAHILDGRLPHALLLEIFTQEGVGTMVVPDQPAAAG